jgi:hypothetical protein
LSKSTLKILLCASGPDLNLRVCLNTNVLYHDRPSTDICTISHDFDDADGTDYVLSLELFGKLPTHTEIDRHGQIITDRVIQIVDVQFDDISLGNLLYESSVYHHDTNGTTEPIQDRFFGTMGCNGRVEVRFSTPIYLWLLENI